MDCPLCNSTLRPSEHSCDSCGVSLRGRFTQSRLARLGPAHQDVVELLLLSGGNLKDMEREMDVSYPTVRKRVAEAREALVALRSRDEADIAGWLEEVERGTLSPEEATRLIGGLSGK